MLKEFNIPIVWGCVCFLLLYTTFPNDLIYAWLFYSEYKSSYSQIIAQWILQIAPPLIPLITFIFFHKAEVKSKAIVTLTPFLLWVIGRFIVAMIIYFVSVKAGNIDITSEKYISIVKKIYDSEWFFRSITYGITIIACSYAFWRERKFECS